MEKETNSDDEESPVCSDGEIELSSGQTPHFSSSSDEQDSDKDSEFDDCAVSKEEFSAIIEAIKNPRSSGLELYPKNAEGIYRDDHTDVFNSLKRLQTGSRFVVFATKRHFGKIQHRPSGVICNTLLFSTSKPLTLITFVRGKKVRRAHRYYNTQLTRNIEEDVYGHVGINISVVHDVVLGSPKEFDKTFDQMHEYARTTSFPSSLLVMSSDRCAAIAKTIIQPMVSSPMHKDDGDKVGSSAPIIKGKAVSDDSGISDDDSIASSDGEEPRFSSSSDERESDKGCCERCIDVEKRAAVFFPDKNIVLHSEHSTLFGRKSHDKRSTLRKILKIASAFRNSDGGTLILHLNGQKSVDRGLEDFKNIIRGHLVKLIEDRQPFEEAYKIHGLSYIWKSTDYHDCIVLHVSSGSVLSTVNYNTKVRNDHQNQDARAPTIAKILYKSSTPQSRAESKVTGIEFKTYKPRAEEWGKLQGNIADSAEVIWNQLKLGHNITSLSKVKDGGSKSTQLKIHKIDGIEEADFEILSQAIKDKIQKSCSTITKGDHPRFEQGAPKELTTIRPISIPNSRNIGFEIVVNYFDGIVFNDSKGPSAYVIKNGNVVRLNIDDWMARFERDFRDSE